MATTNQVLKVANCGERIIKHLSSQCYLPNNPEESRGHPLRTGISLPRDFQFKPFLGPSLDQLRSLVGNPGHLLSGQGGGAEAGPPGGGLVPRAPGIMGKAISSLHLQQKGIIALSGNLKGESGMF